MALAPKRDGLGLKLWVAGALLYLVPQAFAEIALGWHYRAYVHWAAFFALVVVPSFPFFLFIAEKFATRKGKEAGDGAYLLALGLSFVLTFALFFVISEEKTLGDGKTIEVLEESGFLEDNVYRYAEKRGPFFMEDIPRPTNEELYVLRHQSRF